MIDQLKNLENMLEDTTAHNRNLEKQLLDLICHNNNLEKMLEDATAHSRNLEEKLLDLTRHKNNLGEMLEEISDHNSNLDKMLFDFKKVIEDKKEKIGSLTISVRNNERILRGILNSWVYKIASRINSIRRLIPGNTNNFSDPFKLPMVMDFRHEYSASILKVPENPYKLRRGWCNHNMQSRKVNMNRQDLAVMVDARREDDAYDIFRWSLVSPQHKYLWIIMPKVACVTTTLTLREFEGNPYRGGEMWDDEDVLKLRDFGTDEIVEMLTSSDWCRFCFVRNPYDRLFSAYKAKIGIPEAAEPYYQEVQMEIRKIFGYPQRDGQRVGIVSFRDFVRYVHGGGRPHDNHWCVQMRKLTTEMISYDYIGRFETFQRDLQNLLERLGAPPEVLAFAAKVHGQSVKVCLAAAYDRELADTVYKIYRDDFQVFGYDRESWMFQ